MQKLPDGKWESKGQAFETLVARLKQAGPKGFRAVLWHQGESDANQKDMTRTLQGKLYREYLERVIRDSRHEIGWDAPWFVAQVSHQQAATLQFLRKMAILFIVGTFASSLLEPISMTSIS